jgi:thiamine-phosphate pyrophosphorylase
MRGPEPTIPTLWLCADLDAIDRIVLVERVDAVAARWPCAIWLRSRIETPARMVFDAAERLAEIATRRGSQLWIGDRCDVAIAVDASGIHLGSRGLSTKQVRSLAPHRRDGSVMRVSAAVHDAWSVRDAAPDANVLVLSPFGAVPEKGAPLGVAGFAACVSAAPSMPFIALGGIVSRADVDAAMRAGASAFAVRRALIAGDDPVDAIEALMDARIPARSSERPQQT